MNTVYSEIVSAAFNSSREEINITIANELTPVRVRLRNIQALQALAEAVEAPKLLALCKVHNGEVREALDASYDNLDTGTRNDRIRGAVRSASRDTLEAIRDLGPAYFAKLAKEAIGRPITYSIEEFEPEETKLNEFGELETRKLDPVQFVQLVPVGANQDEIAEVVL